MLTCIQSVAGVLWGLLVQSHTKSSSRKFWYQFGLLSGDIGFLMVFFIHSKYLLIIPFIFIGIMYLVINTQPFSLLTESLDGKHDGAYLGLFNCSICLPQIVASIASFWIFPLVGNSMPSMFIVGAVSLFIAAFTVHFIKEK